MRRPIRDPAATREAGAPATPTRPARVHVHSGDVVVWMPAEHPLAQRWTDERGETFTVDQWRRFRVRGVLGHVEERRTDGTWTPITTGLEPAAGDIGRLMSSRTGLGAALVNLI